MIDKYNPPAASRIDKKDNELLIDVAYGRGVYKSTIVREAIHEYCERIRSIRKNLRKEK